MKSKFAFLSLLYLIPAASLLPAAVITTGSLQLRNGDQGGSATFNVQGIGLQLSLSQNLGVQFSAPPYCANACSFDFTKSAFSFTQTLASGLLDGSSYSGQVMTVSLQIQSAIASATANCFTSPGHPPLCQTDWGPTPFTITGTISVINPSTSERFTHLISGSGIATASARNYFPIDETSYTAITYDFQTPEPSTVASITAAALLLFALRDRLNVAKSPTHTQ